MWSFGKWTRFVPKNSFLNTNRYALGIFTLILSTFLMSQVQANGQGYVDKVVVNKTERKLYLIKGKEVLKSFSVALGQRPEGRKLFEGDNRTPEGSYVLYKRNPNSKYFLSIQISYPNKQDRLRAQELGVPPGGMIMIHGQPNELKYSEVHYKKNDWTEGCIAVSNSAMLDIWFLTGKNTPIEIVP